MKTYQTIDNGGNSYVVTISKKVAKIYTPNSDKVKKEFEVKKVFVGKDPSDDRWNGNTILLYLGKAPAKAGGETDKHVYIWIGSNVFRFKTDEKITKYYSRMGNSGVPYPYAFSKKYVYLMVEQAHPILKKDLFPSSYELSYEDPYTYYYNSEAMQKKYSNKKPKGYKVILKRL